MTYSNLGPVVPSTGPLNAKIFILAESPGEEESSLLRPLVGPSGQELRRMLATIGVRLEDCYKSNVFSRRAPREATEETYGVPKDHPLALNALGPMSSNPILYLNSDFAPELERVYAEIHAVNPNVVIALGNFASWALGLGTGINSLRGNVHVGNIPGLSRPIKIVPTYHPALVLRQWSERTVALSDLEKAHGESHSPDFNYDNSELWLDPSLRDIAEFEHLHMRGAHTCATDVETKRGQITCVSFAPSVNHVLSIPFWIDGPDPNYWSEEDEPLAWGFVRRWIEDPGLVKVLQNGLYDLQYFIAHGMKPRNFSEDTMLQHHSLFSELRKGLGFLGSVYTNTPSWKFMRTYRQEEALKRDD